jgi:xanthine dehydrogenase accessory factor
MAEADLWSAIAGTLAAGGPCALIVVADSTGSSPGRQGAVMAVAAQGALGGTIGGGVPESLLVARVAADLVTGALSNRLISWQHRPGGPEASGLLCGGSQRVAVCRLSAEDLPGVLEVSAALRAGRRAGWRIGPDGWRCVDVEPGLRESAGSWCYQHRSGPSHTVHIVGAGHVGSALAHLLLDLEFRVVLIDERPGDGLAAVPGHAHHRVPYEQLASVVAPGEGSFAAIMAHSHDRDAAALAALAPIPLGYLGLLGSRAKVRRILAQTACEVPAASFHAPMGVPIGSVTPTEIAVSIAAEMVAVRVGR